MEYRFSLRAARAYADMTLKEAAREIGINYTTLQNWETGKTVPKATQLTQMAELYGVRAEDIFLPSKSIQS